MNRRDFLAATLATPALASVAPFLPSQVQPHSAAITAPVTARIKGFYTGYSILITGGTGAGQYCYIIENAINWVVTPDETSSFAIFPPPMPLPLEPDGRDTSLRSIASFTGVANLRALLGQSADGNPSH